MSKIHLDKIVISQYKLIGDLSVKFNTNKTLLRFDTLIRAKQFTECCISMCSLPFAESYITQENIKFGNPEVSIKGFFTESAFFSREFCVDASAKIQQGALVYKILNSSKEKFLYFQEFFSKDKKFKVQTLVNDENIAQIAIVNVLYDDLTWAQVEKKISEIKTITPNTQIIVTTTSDKFATSFYKN